MKQLYNKLVSNLYGLYRLLRYVKFFPKAALNGKNIAIIGAASTALEVARKDYVHSFDYIVRVNRAIISWKKEQEKFIGKRTDILFHNFHENDDTGGAGRLDIRLFKEYGLKYLIQPRFDYVGIRTIINFYKKYRSDYVSYTLSPFEYRKLKIKFREFHPTRGYYALHTILSSSCSSVFITGFTFFLTPYQGGYRSNQPDVASIDAHIKSQGFHSPSLELELFLDLIEASRVKRIILDEFLYNLVLDKKPILADKVICVGGE